MRKEEVRTGRKQVSCHQCGNHHHHVFTTPFCVCVGVRVGETEIVCVCASSDETL